MLKNTVESYGLVAIVIHWLMAFAIFATFGLGLYMVELNYYDRWYKRAFDIHKSIGICLAIAWAVRLTWRKLNPVPKALANKTWEINLARAVHALLYLSLLVLFISGYLISTADGRAISVFGFFEIGATLTFDKQEDAAGVVHEAAGWTLCVLVVLHIVGALKHHFIDGDNTLRRMLRGGSGLSAS
ncbi:MAG: cytochrome b [Gammaproteobacteria bacterium]